MNYSSNYYQSNIPWDEKPESGTDRPELKLRDYQIELVGLVEAEFSLGLKRVLLQSPCGSGKTIIAVALIRLALDKGEEVLFLAHRRELVFQCSDKLKWLGIPHGIIMAGEPRSLIESVQVASIQTLIKRLKRNTISLPMANLIICDECHHNASKTHLELIDQYPEARIIGLTATPQRHDGKGLGVRKL